MNPAQMLLLFQMQQMNNAWQTTQNGRTGMFDDTITSGDSNSQLFSLLLLEALGGGMADPGRFNNQVSPVSQVKEKTAGSVEKSIDAMAQKYSVNPCLIEQVVKAESGFNTNATSAAGAMGLMQLMPGTAASYGVQNPYDPTQNLDGGTHFLKDLLDRYQGNIPLTLAAYNAGPGAVEKYQGVPPYKETQAYVQNIMAGLNQKDWKA